MSTMAVSIVMLSGPAMSTHVAATAMVPTRMPVQTLGAMSTVYAVNETAPARSALFTRLFGLIRARLADELGIGRYPIGVVRWRFVGKLGIYWCGGR